MEPEDLNHHKTLLTVLHSIRENIGKSKEGICNQIVDNYQSIKRASTLNAMYRICQSIWITWKYYSGSIHFPVPAPVKPSHTPDEPIMLNLQDGAALAAFLLSPRWTGSYGELRRDLLNFLISEVEARIKDVD